MLPHKKYTVHQPTICPPIYLMARFASVETVVWLTDDYAKDGNDGWHTRFKLGNGTVVHLWLKSRSNSKIHDVELDRPDRWWKKTTTTLYQLYGRSPYYQPIMAMLNKSYETSNGLFYKLCTTFTEEVFNYLGMSTIFIDVRDIVTKQGTASDWLSAIGKEINATHYVCAADACTKYLDIKSFTYFGIHIEAQDFILPSNYSVNPTTSILDLLFLYSAVEVSNILRG